MTPRQKEKIFRTPDTYGYFTATYTPIKPLSIALSGTYTGNMLVQRMDITAENAAMGDMPERKAEAILTPKFFDLGVKIAYDFKLYKTVDLRLAEVFRISSNLIRRTSTGELTGIPAISMAPHFREVFCGSKD